MDYFMLSENDPDKSKTLCEQCKEPSKYCCPKCTVRSCSLECVQEHKKLTECDGIRDKTKFVKLSEFSDIDLLNDYRLLEETGTVLDGAHRENRIRGVHYNNLLPPWLYKIQIEARKRNVNLKIMPASFTKRKTNTTRFDTKNQKIMWHIQWHFEQANVYRTDRRIPETVRISSMLDKHLKENIGTETDHPLAFYQAAGIFGVVILLKEESLPQNHPNQGKYHHLAASQTIAEALAGKSFIEFPTFVIALKDQIYSYPLIEPLEPNDVSSSSDSESDSSSSSED